MGRRAGPISPRRGAAALACLLLGVYLLTTGGHLYAIDEEQMYGLAEAIGARGSLALNDPGPAEPPIYSTYGPGQSLAALPLFWAGSAAGKLLPPAARPWLARAAVGWLNPIVTALAGGLLYLAARRLSGHTGALLTALIYGLGSTAWPHSKTFFAEPLNALLWLGAFVALWRPGTAPAGLRAFALAGLLAGLAPTVKIQAVVGLPLLALHAAWELRRAPRRGYAALAWVAGAGLPLAALAAYNTALFGGPLRSGYGGEVLASFTTPFWAGFSGQLWGLRRGLIWHSPLLLLGLPGLAALWRRERAAALLCAAVPLSQLLFYASWYAWEGAGAWGPRFLNVALPFVALPIAALTQAAMRRTAQDATVETPSLDKEPGGWHSMPQRGDEPTRHGSAAGWLRTAVLLLALLTLPAQLGGLAININQVLTGPGSDAPSQIGAHLGRLVSQVERAYLRGVQPGRLVLAQGLAPSEGRDPALLPRWTRPAAEIWARPNGPALLQLAVESCYALPAPSVLTMTLDGGVIAASHSPCPGRIYRLLLAGPARVELISPGWSPAAAGVARDEPALGLYLRDARLVVGGARLPLVGDRLPAEGPPMGAGELRRWLGDPRLALWDVWWALLLLLPLSGPAQAGVAIVWAGVALLSLGAGGILLHPRSLL